MGEGKDGIKRNMGLVGVREAYGGGEESKVNGVVGEMSVHWVGATGERGAGVGEILFGIGEFIFHTIEFQATQLEHEVMFFQFVYVFILVMEKDKDRKVSLGMEKGVHG